MQEACVQFDGSAFGLNGAEEGQLLRKMQRQRPVGPQAGPRTESVIDGNFASVDKHGYQPTDIAKRSVVGQAPEYQTLLTDAAGIAPGRECVQKNRRFWASAHVLGKTPAPRPRDGIRSPYGH